MAIVHFDSSAFVKLVVEEDVSDLAAALWDGCDAAVSSRLAYPDVRAALAAAGHEVAEVTPPDYETAVGLWHSFLFAERHPAAGALAGHGETAQRFLTAVLDSEPRPDPEAYVDTFVRRRRLAGARGTSSPSTR